MIPTPRHRWRASFWFVPAMIVPGAVGPATGLIALDANVELHFDKEWPLFLGAGAAGSRGLRAAVASSMINEESTIPPPFDMTVLDDLDRFHLVTDTVDRVPHAGDEGTALKKQRQERLIEHNRHVDEHGRDLLEIRNGKWRS